MKVPSKRALALLVCAVMGAGCATVSLEDVAYELEARVVRCLDVGREGEVRVVAGVARGRLEVRSTDGLAPDEEHCARELVGQQRISRRFHRARFRFRHARGNAPHAALTFMRARRDAVIACRPCMTTHVVATPVGARYALSVELLDGEPALDVQQGACVVAALQGLPGPTGDRREVVAVIRDDRAECELLLGPR